MHIHRWALWRRLVACVLMALVAALAIASSAFAAPKISEAAYTNAIAYDLKSLQSTHFYATFDRPVWAELTIHDGAGRKVAKIFDGSISEANKRFWFPSWNGKNSAGKRLPSSGAYIWKLRAVSDGQESVTTGKIAVCKVLFTMRGDFPTAREQKPAWEPIYERYMVKGAATIYTRAVRGGDDATPLSIYYASRSESTQYYGKLGDWDVSASQPLNTTTYLRGTKAIPRQGWYEFSFNISGSLWYEVTVIQ